MKEQELTEAKSKLATQNEELQKEKKVLGERLTAEIRQREKLQVELQNIQRSLGSLKGQGENMTFEQLLVRNKELENQVIVMKCQMKPVVVYNKEMGTFEYIS